MNKRASVLHEFKAVYHIGTWPDAPDEGRKPGHTGSYEGIGLSVSVHPEAWMHIVKLGGFPIRKLAREDGNVGRFVDAYDRLEEARAWALARGWLAGRPGWEVSWCDDEMEDTMSMQLLDEQEAREEADGRGELRQITIWVASGELLTRLDVHYGKQKYDQHGSLDGELLNRWTAITRPELDGVWWDSELDETRLTAPGGIILPEKLAEWRVA